ncbi:hypothetical protein NUW58_g6357 [Xylaria curta]|uniref:Uncharacterized protein n=1 Tax=Xylaria curta TaxID=42375 RepID=A0ACC1NWA4_9PEZI|nr:hypothetical protein NUW58_g6357 [Xylaria curta]
MHFKSLLIAGAIFAPLLAAAPAGDSEAKSADHVARSMEADPLFKVMAWKQGLDKILEDALRDGPSQNNKAWLAYPPWPN